MRVKAGRCESAVVAGLRDGRQAMGERSRMSRRRPVFAVVISRVVELEALALKP